MQKQHVCTEINNPYGMKSTYYRTSLPAGFPATSHSMIFLTLQVGIVVLKATKLHSSRRLNDWLCIAAQKYVQLFTVSRSKKFAQNYYMTDNVGLKIELDLMFEKLQSSLRSLLTICVFKNLIAYTQY